MVPVDKMHEALKRGQSPANLVNWHHFKEVLRASFTRLGKLRQAGGELGARQINGVFAAHQRHVRFKKAAKASKAVAHYRAATDANKRCGVCWMFQTPDQCISVEGHIDVNAVCDYFETIFAKATGNQFNFDSFAPSVQQNIRRAQDVFIAQLESDARDSIQTIISDGVRNGTPLDDVASNIRDLIGLTDTQAQAVLNYQRMLMELDPGALARQLRNTDYDAVLQDAIDNDTSLSDAAIQSMVDDYTDNYLDYRAATIAQTESTRAANAGLHDAYSQAVERGALPEDAITRQWQLADNPCPICESIADNNEDGVGLNEDFDSDEGPISDPPVHPNCECSVDYVTDLTQVPDEGDSEFEEQTQF